MRLTNFFGKPRTNVVASILEFHAIDTDGMIKKMRLKERAKENGEKDLPRSDSECFDAVEQNIVNEIEAEAKTQFSTYLEHQKTYAERASDATVSVLVLQIGSTVTDATTNFQGNTHVGTDDLYARKRDVIESEGELRRFRERNGLERPPRDYGPQPYKKGLLLLILAIESILNGFFLSKGSDFGLLGGVFQALIIASINVFVGAGVGRHVLPWIIPRDWSLRIFAAAAMAAYLLASAGFNLAVAHYRNAVASDPFEASFIAYHSLLSNPLDINDLQSWLLFLVGFLFALLAAVDGFCMDDPYPGYGQRMRHKCEASEEYTALKKELLTDLEQIKQSAEDKIDELVRNIETRQGECDHISQKSQALKQSMLQHFTHLESAANTLLSYYRDENRRHRQTQAPSRFNGQWKYTHPVIEGEVVINVNRDHGLRKVLEEVPRQRETLHTSFLRACDEYKRIDELVELESKT